MVCLFLCVMVYAQQKTVNVEEAGTLSTLLSEDEVENLTDLKLTGNINGSDIYLIRKMGGAQNHWEGDGFGKYISYGHLNNLDLADVHVMSGGISFSSIQDVIVSGTFMNCCNLESVILPKSVKAVGSSVFACCNNLKTVEFPDVQELGGGMFSRCPNLEKVDIPKSVIKLGYCFFDGNYNLKEVSLPSVIEIGDSTFVYCTSLEKVTLGAVQKIGKAAFWGDTQLTNIYLPASMTEISKDAFAYCGNLSRIIITAIKPPVCGINVFEGIDGNCTVYVPKGCGENYKTANEWKNMNIVETDLEGIDLPGVQKEQKEIARYNAAGLKMKKPIPGINIVRMSNGHTKKVWVK